MATETKPETSAAPAPQVVVQMIQPIANEPTEGLSQAQAGGKFIVDGKTVDAHGKAI